MKSDEKLLGKKQPHGNKLSLSGFIDIKERIKEEWKKELNDMCVKVSRE